MKGPRGGRPKRRTSTNPAWASRRRISAPVYMRTERRRRSTRRPRRKVHVEIMRPERAFQRWAWSMVTPARVSRERGRTCWGSLVPLTVSDAVLEEGLGRLEKALIAARG